MKLSEALDAAAQNLSIKESYPLASRLSSAADAAREMEQRLSDNDDAIGMLMQKIAALEKAKEPEILKCSRSDCPGHADMLKECPPRPSGWRARTNAVEQGTARDPGIYPVIEIHPEAQRVRMHMVVGSNTGHVNMRRPPDWHACIGEHPMYEDFIYAHADFLQISEAK